MLDRFDNGRGVRQSSPAFGAAGERAFVRADEAIAETFQLLDVALGGGVAPWNVLQYTFLRSSEKITGTEKASGKKFDLVFFHFHGVRFFKNDVVLLLGSLFDLNDEVIGTFYKPYIKQLNQQKKIINAIDPAFDPNGATVEAPIKPATLKEIIKLYFYYLKQSPANIFGQNVRNRMAHRYYYKSEDFNS